MFKNYLKIALRNLWKHRLFTAINVVGLSLGLASAGVLILFVQRGVTFDTFHKDNDQIYFVQTEGGGERYNQTVYPILGQMLKTFPEIQTGTHVQGWNNVWINHHGKDIQGATKYVDSAFFDVFSFSFLYGNRQTAFKRKESIVLTKRVASALFGDINPVGQTVAVNDSLQVTVTGVLQELPSNSSIQFEVLMPISFLEADANFRNNADWYNTFASVYLKLHQGADLSKLDREFPAFGKEHFGAEAKSRRIRIAPFKDYIHYENPSFRWLIYGAVTIAAFILLIISINLINLNTAISFTRAKEVAVRKVTGSSLGQILIQFWTESGIVLILSLAISVLFGLWYLVPQFNEFRKGRMQLVVSWEQDYQTILVLLAIIITIAVIAGTYPALRLDRLDVRDTIKGKLSGQAKSGSWSRGVLIVVQLVISFGLVMGAITVRKQISFMRDAHPGFEKDGVIIVPSDLQFKDETRAQQEFRPVLQELTQNAHVLSVATSGVVPTKYWSNYNTYLPEGDEDKEVKFKHVGTGPGYVETFRINMLEGRDFDSDLDGDGANHPVVINESAMKAMGWKTAVGKRLKQKSNPEVYTVVGVMKDFHYQELKEKIEPLLHWYEPAGLNNYLSIRFENVSQAASVLSQLERKMKAIPSRKPFQYFYLSDEISRQYNHLDGIWKMLNFVTTLSVVIALAGIFGLITLAGSQRTKEIGIRKTLGASVSGLVLLLSRDFLILVLISIVIGVPLGYWFEIKYLSTFQYHMTIEWYVFALVALSAIALTLLTVSVQSIRTALMNPVKSLRSE